MIDNDETSGKRIARAFSHLLDRDAQVGIATVIDSDADHHYQTGWDDAIEAAAMMVDEDPFGGYVNLRRLSARIRGLKGSK
jgi:hypothetical protein